MMTIIQRNFFRLIRSGAFNRQEQVEPMSPYKWGQLYKLALMHEVALEVYEGLQKCKDQCFLHLTEKQWAQWEHTVNEIRRKPQEETDSDDEFLRADHLTNPLLNRKLQNILDDEQSDTYTRQLLLTIIRCARHIMNEGIPVREFVTMGYELRKDGQRIDFITLEKWIKSLHLQQMAQLEGSLLAEYLGFEQEEITFVGKKINKEVERVAQELIKYNNKHAEEFYFSQNEDNIFVHTKNGSAMLGHFRRSARYFRYFPSESLTNFFASFAHSLSHIEE